MDNLLVHGCALVWMSRSFHAFCELLAKVPEESLNCRHTSLRRVSGGSYDSYFRELIPSFSFVIIPDAVMDSSFTAL